MFCTQRVPTSSECCEAPNERGCHCSGTSKNFALPIVASRLPGVTLNIKKAWRIISLASAASLTHDSIKRACSDKSLPTAFANAFPTSFPSPGTAGAGTDCGSDHLTELVTSQSVFERVGRGERQVSDTRGSAQVSHRYKVTEGFGDASV